MLLWTHKILDLNATSLGYDDGLDHIFRETRMLVFNHITTLDNKSTSVIFVSRSEGTQISYLSCSIVVSMKNKFQPKYYLKLKYFIPPVLH
jgi:hypothetical protein